LYSFGLSDGFVGVGVTYIQKFGVGAESDVQTGFDLEQVVVGIIGRLGGGVDADACPLCD